MYAQLIKSLSTNLTAGEKRFQFDKKPKKGFHAIFQLKKRFFLKKLEKKGLYSKKGQNLFKRFPWDACNYNIN